MTNILMVCLGNICRSPLAEGILRAKLPEANFTIDSVGTADYHIGSPPDKRSVAVGKKYGIDISSLKGRQFEITDFDNFDLIYAMDRSVFNDVLELARGEKDVKKVSLILNELTPDENLEVPDPYYGGDEGFEIVYKMLNKACDALVRRLNL